MSTLLNPANVAFLMLQHYHNLGIEPTSSENFSCVDHEFCENFITVLDGCNIPACSGHFMEESETLTILDDDDMDSHNKNDEHSDCESKVTSGSNEGTHNENNEDSVAEVTADTNERNNEPQLEIPNNEGNSQQCTPPDLPSSYQVSKRVDPFRRSGSIFEV